MKDVLVELINLEDPKIKHSPLHVSLMFTTEDIRKYLNSVFKDGKHYKFYMNGVLFNGCLTDEASRRSFEIERGLKIGYKTDRNAVLKIVQRLEDVISLLSVTENEEDVSSLWCCTYEGVLREYMHKDGLMSIKEIFKHRSVTGIAFGNSVYICDMFGNVTDIRTDKIVFHVNSRKIACIAAFGKMISVGTEDGECFVFVNELKMAHKFRTRIVFTEIGENTARFVSVCGREGLLDVPTEDFEEKEIGHKITAVDCRRNEIQVFGTPYSKLILTKACEKTIMRTSIRFCTHVAIRDTTTIALASQHDISVVDAKNSVETKRISISEPISGIGWAKDTLFIGAGCNIYEYQV